VKKDDQNGKTKDVNVKRLINFIYKREKKRDLPEEKAVNTNIKRAGIYLRLLVVEYPNLF
jgi:hypothetical protein